MINNPSKGQEIPETGSGRFPDGGHFFARVGQKIKYESRGEARPAFRFFRPKGGREKNIKR